MLISLFSGSMLHLYEKKESVYNKHYLEPYTAVPGGKSIGVLYSLVLTILGLQYNVLKTCRDKTPTFYHTCKMLPYLVIHSS